MSDEKRSNVKDSIFTGKGMAIVAIIALIAVFASGCRSKAVDFDTLEFAKEYKVTDEKNNTYTFDYPETLYTGFTEENSDGFISLTSESENAKNPGMIVIISEPIYDENETTVMSAKFSQSNFEDIISTVLSGFIVSDVKVSDISSDTPGKYFYNCMVSTEDGQTGAASAWLEPNGNGNYSCFLGLFLEMGDDPVRVIKLRDMFEEKNSDDAMKIPGANPPETADMDGMLEVDAIHMGIKVPKDRFKKMDSSDENMLWWVDDNGAIYAVSFMESDFDFDTAAQLQDELKPTIMEIADSGAGLKGLPDLDSKMMIRDSWPSTLGYRAEFKDLFGGVTYWEADYTSMWQDLRTHKYYFYDIAIMAPNCNADIYRQLFDKAINEKLDI